MFRYPDIGIAGALCLKTISDGVVMELLGPGYTMAIFVT
jgi:hypothetical protein